MSNLEGTYHPNTNDMTWSPWKKVGNSTLRLSIPRLPTMLVHEWPRFIRQTQATGPSYSLPVTRWWFSIRIPTPTSSRPPEQTTALTSHPSCLWLWVQIRIGEGSEDQTSGSQANVDGERGLVVLLPPFRLPPRLPPFRLPSSQLPPFRFPSSRLPSSGLPFPSSRLPSVRLLSSRLNRFGQ